MCYLISQNDQLLMHPTLTYAEKNYAQVKKEALTFAVKKFHQYFMGVFLLPLQITSNSLFGCSAPATLGSSTPSLLLPYKSTNQHDNADALSRLPLLEADIVQYLLPMSLLVSTLDKLKLYQLCHKWFKMLLGKILFSPRC